MFVFIENLYGAQNGHRAYYRKNGNCFDFVHHKEFATPLTKEEAMHVLERGDFYLKTFNANTIGIEDWTF